MDDANRMIEGYNPLCGDHYVVYLKIENDIITDISFEGTGCAISKASASVMSTLVRGKTKAEVEALFSIYHKLVKGEIDPVEYHDKLGKLAVFSGVSEFPARVKCATLSWHTLHAALESDDKVVSTE